MRILIIEDDHLIAQAIKKGIEQENKIYTADIRFDGITGFDLACAEKYDCIILDRMLPGMNGMDICTNLRKEHIHTPILMLTAKSQTYEKVEGLNSGADDYLTKPFSFDELIARLKALTRRPTDIVTSTFTYADVVINIDTFTVLRSGQTISLSQKEFQILQYFVKNPETIITKEQLISHIWHVDSDVLPNTVEAFIKNIRKKIDKPFPQKPLLHTVRGFGYKLSEK